MTKTSRAQCVLRETPWFLQIKYDPVDSTKALIQYNDSKPWSIHHCIERGKEQGVLWSSHSHVVENGFFRVVEVGDQLVTIQITPEKIPESTLPTRFLGVDSDQILIAQSEPYVWRLEPGPPHPDTNMWEDI